eukprot:m.161461 g.161461  ORF g.161461 m.161461 type:complete len:567 (+) comp15187_c0_seq17:2171-3871(+)
MATGDEAVVQLLAEKLATILGFPTPEDAMDIAGYAASMKTDEMSTYLREILGDSKQLDSLIQDVQKISLSTALPPGTQVYQKGAHNDVKDSLQLSQQGKPHLRQVVGGAVIKESTKKQGKKKAAQIQQDVQAEPTINQSSDSSTTKKPKKGGYVNLYSKEGEGKVSQLLPGRVDCGCNATKHDLVNNCIHCGRIVCTQEGVGPCITCGELVCTPEMNEILSRGSRKSEKLKEKIMKDVQDKAEKAEKALTAALEHKQRLLNYQSSGARRMKVIDDESDYYSSDNNKWLTSQQKEAIKKKELQRRQRKEEARRANTIQIDFTNGGSVISVDTSKDLPDMYSHEINDEQEDDGKDDHNMGFGENPYLPENVQKPTYKPQEAQNVTQNVSASESKNRSRLQDANISIMSDSGQCLSMHQPWASLLVRGIKKHEGRAWYSSHRGRLWIAATSQEPDQESIESLEKFYREYYGSDDLNFPKHYPHGCLLGCIDVDEVLPKEDYQEKFPEGESQSPFVFVCSNPQELVLCFPISGKHKIWKLEKTTHQQAKAGVRPVNPGNAAMNAKYFMPK